MQREALGGRGQSWKTDSLGGVFEEVHPRCLWAMDCGGQNTSGLCSAGEGWRGSHWGDICYRRRRLGRTLVGLGDWLEVEGEGDESTENDLEVQPEHRGAG